MKNRVWPYPHVRVYPKSGWERVDGTEGANPTFEATVRYHIVNPTDTCVGRCPCKSGQAPLTADEAGRILGELLG